MLFSSVLAVDFGEARIGLAQRTGVDVPPLPWRTDRTSADPVAQLEALWRDAQHAAVVFGWPLLPTGRAGRMARRVQQCAVALAPRIAAAVFLVDERFSSESANQLLGAASQVRGRTDQVAACLLLEHFDRLSALRRPGQAETPPGLVEV